MKSNQATLAQDYLDKKGELLNECLASTEALLGAIGDIRTSNDILVKRKALLQKLNQLDLELGSSLAGYAFDEGEFNQLEILAQTLWSLDDKVTRTMKENKTDILKSFQ